MPHEILTDSKFRGAAVIFPDNVYRLLKASEGVLFERFLDDRFIQNSYGVQFAKNHKLFNIFDAKMQQLFESGLVNVFAEPWFKYLNPKHPWYKHLRNLNEGPKVLTLEHLQAGFIVWLCSLSFAFAAFGFEFIFKYKDCLIIQMYYLYYYYL